MRVHRTLLPLLLVPLIGCASVTTTTASNGGAGPSKEGGEAAELEKARAQLEIAGLEMESYEAKQADRLRFAAAELALAESELALFKSSKAPNRLASEELDVRAAKDRAQEAAEELAQIEIMYEDQDLDDLTAEFVVSRGRRSAERAAARIEILEAGLVALETSELPREQKRLELAVERARSQVADVERETEIGRRKKALELAAAKKNVEELGGDESEGS